MIVLDLNGAWKMKRTTEEEWIDAVVPGSVYRDLLAAGKLEDPFFRDYENSVKELSRYNYEYKRVFKVNDEIMNSERIFLCCEGLDTLAEIIVNSHSLAETNNMHRSYEFDIKSFLVEEENTIHLVFKSPLEFIAKKNEGNPLWNAGDTEPGISHLRKSHYMFGWDWGPALPDMGIWRNIGIKGYNDARIRDVYVSQEHRDKRVVLDVRVGRELWVDESTEIIVKITSPGGETSKKRLSSANNEEHLAMTVDDPELWWPNGYGERPLYAVDVLLKKDGQLLDDRTLRIGLRTLTIRQETDEWGKSFEFEINGVSMFAKGANYIPEDNLLSRCSRERTEKLIDDCVAANFNCIRVWGGGIYPEDYFYDLCDEYGLIVWQDLMFACAVYEMTDEFSENIEKETEDNIRRLRHHASLGLWCGNNEMEWGWVEWQLPDNEKLKDDYLKQFEELLPRVARKTDPNTFYWLASPSSGGGFDKPNDENCGDVHDWMVWHGRQPFTYFRQHHYRFLSEFGLQSFPGLKTVESFTLPEDRNIFSHVMEHHQKNGTSNETILYYISQTFKYPKDFDSLLYASQLVQAEGLKYAVEHLRRHRGRCMGSIYWQLNDCWPVASWSSIDSFGRWKALHYYAKRFYNPVLISACEEGTTVKLHVTNDTREDLAGTVKWSLRDNGYAILQEGSRSVAIEALSATLCQELDFSEILESVEQQRKAYLEYEFLVGDEMLSSGTVLFVKPKHFDFQDPAIEFTIRQKHGKTAISLTSKAFANQVEVDFKNMDAVLSDNYFHLSAGIVKEVEITKTNLTECLSPEELKRKIHVRSIHDIAEILTDKDGCNLQKKNF